VNKYRIVSIERTDNGTTWTVELLRDDRAA
jgi:hypothetical protein